MLKGFIQKVGKMKIDITPNKAKFLESLKTGAGYSFETAVCDIIDNSIDASASAISIKFSMNPLTLTIEDNGIGMSLQGIQEALKYGSISDKEDKQLGKFGFGLKSATFSQANILTVESVQNGYKNVVIFDNEELIRSDGWLINCVTNNEPSTKSNYTIVKWNKFYRLESSEFSREQFLEICSTLKDTIALTFYHYIENGVEIKMNGSKIQSATPFYETDPSCIVIDEKKIKIGSSFAKVTAFDISLVEKKEANLLENQGVYVFRNKRFIKNIGFLMRPKHQSLNNLRIKFEIGGNEDNNINIDFRKSHFSLPNEAAIQINDFISKAIKIKDRRQRTIKVMQKEENTEIIKIWKNSKLNIQNEYVRSFCSENELDIDKLNYFIEVIFKSKGRLHTNDLSGEFYENMLMNIELYKEAGLPMDEILDLVKNHEPYANNFITLRKIKEDNGD